MNRIRIDYEGGGYTLIWYDEDEKKLKAWTAGVSKGKAVLSIGEEDEPNVPRA